MGDGSPLSQFGINALCVGNCDSDGLATHAVWWTNSAAQRRILKSSEQHPKARRQKSIYGIGVVFYLDRQGKIQGIMTWGLPFAEKNGEIKQAVLDNMLEVLTTNGGFRSVQTELEHFKMHQFLETQTKLLLSLALGNDKVLPRPLHRYTEVRSVGSRTATILKSREGMGILGEGLFARVYPDHFDNQIHVPAPKPGNVGSAANKVQALYDWNVWEQKERLFEDNEAIARPAREEPLWIRKGDEGRSTPLSERIGAAYGLAFGQKRQDGR